jgi:hypothetical protein
MWREGVLWTHPVYVTQGGRPCLNMQSTLPSEILNKNGRQTTSSLRLICFHIHLAYVTGIDFTEHRLSPMRVGKRITGRGLGRLKVVRGRLGLRVNFGTRVSPDSMNRG